MKESLSVVLEQLSKAAAYGPYAGNDNSVPAMSYDEIKKQAEALTKESSTEQVAEVIHLMFFAGIGGIERGKLIAIINNRTDISKNDIKHHLKLLKEKNTLQPVDPALNVVNHVLKKHWKDGEYIRLGADGRFWIYNGKYWEPCSDSDIWSKVVAGTEELYGQSKTSLKKIATDAKELLKAKVFSLSGKFDPYEDPKPVVNCRNVEVWIRPDGSYELREHDPESGQTYCLDVDFDEKALCPEFKNALKGIFKNADDPDGMIRHLLELFGYTLQPDRDIPLYVVFFGSGRNGKTKLAYTLINLIGKCGFYVDRVNKLESNRFTIAQLAGKRIFLDDDVTEGTKLPDGLLKTMAESKEMSGEHKFKDRFMFVCRVVPYLLCNNYPNLTDLSVGMQRRAMVIPFDRIFTPEEVDADLFDRITDNELAGVLNLALAGLKRLRERGGFEYPVDVVEANNDWFAHCSSLAAFINQQCKLSANAKCKVSDLYQLYSVWTDGQGFKHVTPKNKMGAELKALGYTVKKVGGYPWVYGLKHMSENMLQVGPGSVSKQEAEEFSSSM